MFVFFVFVFFVFRLFVCMFVCMFVCTFVCTFVRIFVCMFVCTFVCTFVCMFVYALLMCIIEIVPTQKLYKFGDQQHAHFRNTARILCHSLYCVVTLYQTFHILFICVKEILNWQISLLACI